MGRIRTIKPELFTHGDLFDAEVEFGLPLRIAFAGIWCQADREGRFKWKPRELKIHVLPYDDCDFSRVLDALVTRGFLVKYEHEGQHFGAIPSWKDHQFINNKEPQSHIPEPVYFVEVDASVTRGPREEITSSTRGVKEGKGKEGEGRVENASTPTHEKIEIPSWLPSEEWSEFVHMRKRIKKPMTSHAEVLALRRLIGFYDEGYDAVDMLQQCVMNNWQGFVIEKAKKRHSNSIVRESDFDRLKRQQEEALRKIELENSNAIH